MPIFTMLIRSIMSYTIFLASRKIVQGSLGVGESLKKGLSLHRCTDCWRLYSGEITECSFCRSFVKPLYQIYQEDVYRPYNQQENKFESRQGLEKQVYNDSRHMEFKPLEIPKMETRHDRSTATTSREPSRGHQGRDRESLGDEWYNRVICNSNS